MICAKVRSSFCEIINLINSDLIDFIDSAKLRFPKFRCFKEICVYSSTLRCVELATTPTFRFMRSSAVYIILYFNPVTATHHISLVLLNAKLFIHIFAVTCEKIF